MAGEQDETGDGSVPGEVTLWISDEVPPERRDSIKASVAALARRSAEASTRAFELGKARNELLTATTGRLRTLMEDDADASMRLAEARRRVENEQVELSMQEPTWPTVKLVERRPLAADADFLADQVWVPPFDFAWEHHKGRPPEVSTTDELNGRIQLHTKVGGLGMSDAHAGFGVSLQSSQVRSVNGRSLRRTQHAYAVAAVSPLGFAGGDATVEGGMEMTVVQAGSLITFAHDRRFRKRVSGDEFDVVPLDGWSTGDGGVQVHWVMERDVPYELNVGAWVYCEAHGGPAAVTSTASARLDGQVISLTADFTD
jgi:hypothetical protein